MCRIFARPSNSCGIPCEAAYLVLVCSTYGLSGRPDGKPLVSGILSVTCENSFPRYRSSLLLYEATHCYDSKDQNNL